MKMVFNKREILGLLYDHLIGLGLDAQEDNYELLATGEEEEPVHISDISISMEIDD